MVFEDVRIWFHELSERRPGSIERRGFRQSPHREETIPKSQRQGPGLSLCVSYKEQICLERPTVPEEFQITQRKER